MTALPTAPLRPPQQVMRLARLGSFHPTRLSFMRALLRDLARHQWRFVRVLWRIDARGEGVATYRASCGARVYTLVCFARDLPDELRSDRVIATRWDTTFALYDGEPDDAELARLRESVPKQEAGQYTARELVLARANKSLRVFGEVVAQLARGAQPSTELLEQSGYLLRTTAVYGNGKFGIADRARLQTRAEFAAPFRAELLSVWLIRWFSIDLVEHLARCKGGARAVRLQRDVARRLGVGNATGLGMAPFLVNHPTLLHHWISARETALARVRAVPQCAPAIEAQFGELLVRAQTLLDAWQTDDARQAQRLDELRADLAKIRARVDAGGLRGKAPWQTLIDWSARELCLEAQELLVSLVIEPHGALVDELSETMSADETRHWCIRGDQPLAQLRESLSRDYDWALSVDYAARQNCARFWYVSEEKLEPRLGERFDEPGAEAELPLATGRDIARLCADLRDARQATVGEFLLEYPQHRHAVRRAQRTARLPYAEIRDNLISAQLLPLDLLRCKLSFFGANKFDPKSDRWVRITLYQHAPLPDELCEAVADDWSYPPRARQ